MPDKDKEKRKSKSKKRHSKSHKSAPSIKCIQQGDIQVSDTMAASPEVFRPTMVKEFQDVYCRLMANSFDFLKDKTSLTPEFQVMTKGCTLYYEKLGEGNALAVGGLVTVVIFCHDDKTMNFECVVLRIPDAKYKSWEGIFEVKMEEIHADTGVMARRKTSMKHDTSKEQESDLNGFLSQIRMRPVSDQIDSHDHEMGASWAHLDENAKALIRNAFGGSHNSSKSDMKRAKRLFDEFSSKGQLDVQGVKKILDKFGLSVSDGDVTAIMRGGAKKPKRHLSFEDFISRFAGFTMYAKVRHLFDKFDDDKSNSIDEEELLNLMRHLKLNPTKKRVKEMLKKYDYDGNGTLDFKEFLDLYSQYALDNIEVDKDKLQSMFDAFDIDKGGTVSCEEITKVLTNSGEKLRVEDVEKAFTVANVAPDSEMNFNEFCRFIQALQ